MEIRIAAHWTFCVAHTEKSGDTARPDLSAHSSLRHRTSVPISPNMQSILHLGGPKIRVRVRVAKRRVAHPAVQSVLQRR